MSLNNKPKKCKGINQAYGYQGCGLPHTNRKYGLCPACLYDFYTTTEPGKVLYQNVFLPKVSKCTKQREQEETKEVRKSLKKLSVWQKELEKVINEICRLIDKGSGCISCNGHTTPQAGHYHSVGSNGSIRFNLHNLHLQDYNCNCEKSGNIHQFDLGLIERYGNDYWHYVKFDIVREYPVLKMPKEEYEGKIKLVREVATTLRRADLEYSPAERLRLRNEYNTKIGIYPTNYPL